MNQKIRLAILWLHIYFTYEVVADLIWESYYHRNRNKNPMPSILESKSKAATLWAKVCVCKCNDAGFLADIEYALINRRV